MRTRVQLCGTFVVEIEGRRLETQIRGRQARLLFMFLVLHRARSVRRDELVAALWPEDRPASPDDALNNLVSRLRKVLGEGVLAGRSELTLVLAADASVDIETVFEAVERAERALERSRWEEAGDAANVALRIAEHGVALDVEAPWLEEERRRVAEARLRALECLAACGIGLGGPRLSATERAARTLIAAAPYRETGYRYLMQALSERGRVAEALTVFEDVRILLREELGALPSPGLRALHARLLRTDETASGTEQEDALAVGPATMTALFTDVLVDVDAGHAQLLRGVHSRLLRRTVAAHGATRVRDTDDGLIVLFNSARSAIRCAVVLQQAADLHNRRFTGPQLSVRVGLHRGEPAALDDAHTSDAGVLARRLCALAQAGQIVVSSSLHLLAGATHPVRDLGAVQPPGAAESVTGLEIAWDPPVDRAFALPPTISVHARGVFVGRDADIERLWRLYELARSGTRQIALLRGEPGIGKTRLATELALRAHSAGAVFLYGRCDEEPLLPHQPFVEALRHYVHACPLPDLAGQVGPGSGELPRLVPELAERLPELAKPLAGDPEGERHRLFEAVTALLCEAAQDRPLVLVLDDLHWADAPTHLLLRHLARGSSQAALLVIGTYRESELEAGGALAGTLAELTRENSFERHPLGFLDKRAVGTLVSTHAGHDAPELAAMIFEQTEGNPFFAVEMLRHLSESDCVQPGELGLPEGVKDVIARRVARLGERTHRVLSLGSVSGRDFELAVLEHVSDLAEDDLVDALEQALRARVIEEVGGAVGRYTFSHALIRETLYRELTATRRALLHRRVAASLEATHAGDLEPYRAELAHHFTQAGSAGDLDKAIEYGARAGDHALAQLAYEQAATYYRQAVGLIASAQRPRQLQRCDLLVAQGEAERHAGDPAYRETLLEAARIAHELGDAERLARAALANNRGFFSSTTGVDRERVAMLRHALDANGPGDSPTHANLLAQLAVELVADPDWPRRLELSDDALAMARRVGDPEMLLRTLIHRYTALWGPRTLADRVATIDEANVIADDLEDPVLAFHATHFGAHAAMEAGDLALADRRLQRAGALAEQLGQPIIQWYIAVGRAKRRSICDAPGDAERLARVAFDLGCRAGQGDAFPWWMLELFQSRFLAGTLGSGEPNFPHLAEIGGLTFQGPAGSRSVPVLVETANLITFCEVGRTDDARRRFDALMAAVGDLPHDWATLSITAQVSITCAHLADTRHASTLYSLLEPHADQFVDSGPGWFGATTHYMALLDATMGRLDRSDGLFAATAAAYERLGAAPWLARARVDWAQMLVARGRRRDSRLAEPLLGEALATARELGLARVEAIATSLLNA